MYDENGEAFGFNYNGNDYYYVRNAQNDVVFITDSANNGVVMYQYDAWGNITACYDTSDDGMLSIVNPYAYRGYYYEIETNTYFLKSRYYNPELHRFICADGYVQTGQGVLDKNMFAYCGNNPINRVDYTGNSWKSIKNWFANKWNGLKSWVSNTFGITSVYESETNIIRNDVIPDPSPITATVGQKQNTTIRSNANSSKKVNAYVKHNANNPIKSSKVGLKFSLSLMSLNFNVGLDDTYLGVAYTRNDIENGFGIKINVTQLKIGFEYYNKQKLDDANSIVDYANAYVSGLFIAAVYELVVYGQPVDTSAYAYG